MFRFEQGRFAEAIEFYYKASEIYPNVALWHFNLGDTLVKAWRFQEAQDQFEMALKIVPGHTKARAGLERVNRLIARKKKMVN